MRTEGAKGLDQEIEAKILSLLEDHMLPIKAIAKRAGVSRNSIQKVMRRYIARQRQKEKSEREWFDRKMELARILLSEAQ